MFLILGTCFIRDIELRPLDIDRWIIPWDAAFACRVIDIGAFINELSMITQDKETVGKPFRDIEHILDFFIEDDAGPFAEGRAVGTAVDGDVKYLSPCDADQFSLRMVFLEMKAAQHTFG